MLDTIPFFLYPFNFITSPLDTLVFRLIPYTRADTSTVTGFDSVSASYEPITPLIESFVALNE